MSSAVTYRARNFTPVLCRWMFGVWIAFTLIFLSGASAARAEEKDNRTATEAEYGNLLERPVELGLGHPPSELLPFSTLDDPDRCVVNLGDGVRVGVGELVDLETSQPDDITNRIPYGEGFITAIDSRRITVRYHFDDPARGRLFADDTWVMQWEGSNVFTCKHAGVPLGPHHRGRLTILIVPNDVIAETGDHVQLNVVDDRGHFFMISAGEIERIEGPIILVSQWWTR